jgi:hypothetical protein
MRERSAPGSPQITKGHVGREFANGEYASEGGSEQVAITTQDRTWLEVLVPHIYPSLLCPQHVELWGFPF